MRVSNETVTRWIGNYQEMGVEPPETLLDLRDARAALWRIAGAGDIYAGIHIIDPGDLQGACNLECEWWCYDHARCAEDQPCDEAMWDVGDEECSFQQHVHCVEGCPTRIALEALGYQERRGGIVWPARG